MTETKVTIAGLRELCERATPAKEVYLDRADFEDGRTVYELHAISNDEKEEMFVAFSTDSHAPQMRAKFNAEFWIEARAALPLLLDEIEKLREASLRVVEQDSGGKPLGEAIISLGKVLAQSLERLP